MEDDTTTPVGGGTAYAEKPLPPDSTSSSTQGVSPGDEHPQADNPQYVSGAKFEAIIGSLVLSCFLSLLDTSVVSTAVPKITDEFHSLADVGWYGSAYSLGSAALQPLTGKIYQHFSLKCSWGKET
ncbi:Uu.00g030830.m01.CDS01 [Anthostomella pinea]|uniref:Uu.00g030830.m01.CDS01 n=1 Tax=Anthostomella pinea TaxID=933095 RepID=A0AAI8V9D9_9PEZI|nr:Uu.00g030830.m01.CDS01 [Anthostomella pinea]